jgi:hypothetical protein
MREASFFQVGGLDSIEQTVHMIAYGTVRSSCLASSAKVTFISPMRA